MGNREDLDVIKQWIRSEYSLDPGTIQFLADELVGKFGEREIVRTIGALLADCRSGDQLAWNVGSVVRVIAEAKPSIAGALRRAAKRGGACPARHAAWLKALLDPDDSTKIPIARGPSRVKATLMPLQECLDISELISRNRGSFLLASGEATVVGYRKQGRLVFDRYQHAAWPGTVVSVIVNLHEKLPLHEIYRDMPPAPGAKAEDYFFDE